MNRWFKAMLLALTGYGLMAGCAMDGGPGMDGPQGMQGPPGTPGMDGNDGMDGANGMNGMDGVDGMDGLHCWDVSEDGVCDPAEDVNSDMACDADDCQGAVGPVGPQGPAGQSGIASCSRFQGNGSAGCQSNQRLTGAFCSCPNSTVSSHNVATPAGNLGGSMSCSCISGTAIVDVMCCF